MTHRLALDWQPRRDENDGGEPRVDDEGWVFREDRGELSKPVRLDDGSMLYDGFASQAGVYTYRDSSGKTWRELVTSETLSRTAHTLSGAPVTVDHPKEDVTDKNVEKYGVGRVDGTPFVDNDGRTRVRLSVDDPRGIKAIEKGSRELSQGYRAKLDYSGGTHPTFGPYDVEQVDRLNNHLAIVKNGRHGFECGLRADAAEFVSRFDGANHPTNGGGMNPALTALAAKLGIVRRDGETDEALAGRVGELFDRNDGEHSTALQAMTTARDEAVTRADAAEAKVTEFEQAELVRVDAEERNGLVELAATHKVDVTKHDSAPALRKAILKAARPQLFARVDGSDEAVAIAIDLLRDESLQTAPPAPPTPTPRQDAGDQWRRNEPRNDNHPRTRVSQSSVSLKAFGRPSAGRSE